MVFEFYKNNEECILEPGVVFTFVYNTVSSIWTIIASVNVVIAHSCTWEKDPHIVHHKYKKYNYGVGLLLMDRILGTYKEE